MPVEGGPKRPLGEKNHKVLGRWGPRTGEATKYMVAAASTSPDVPHARSHPHPQCIYTTTSHSGVSQLKCTLHTYILNIHIHTYINAQVHTCVIVCMYMYARVHLLM